MTITKLTSFSFFFSLLDIEISSFDLPHMHVKIMAAIHRIFTVSATMGEAFAFDILPLTS